MLKYCSQEEGLPFEGTSQASTLISFSLVEPRCRRWRTCNVTDHSHCPDLYRRGYGSHNCATVDIESLFALLDFGVTKGGGPSSSSAAFVLP